ncbi:MAG TPA: flagellar hook-associated protein FlgK [Sedimenticola thiotaurini]|uniref:Flagellar hook-associated protein 1 n=1 Tax=Sedimenticola thiotaurini TaxID=1543721 RepID=A0A831W8L5_9GAMM|nr:flagellar hook-associated protein FlgK [Sedimenticola thiotaurini]
MAGILDIGTSGLLAFQNSLNTTGHNIANAETEGYSRQRTLLATRTPTLTGVGWMGSGVKVADVQRLYDDFLATQVRSTQSAASELATYASHASNIDDLLADPNIGLDPALQDFFDAVQGLADDPASMPVRQALLAETQSMVDRFHDLNRQFTSMQEQLNQELTAATTEINSLAESIARVNQSIVEAIGAAGGDDPSDLLDQREVLLKELSSKVDISVVPQDDGSWNVFIGKGQALVMGSTPATLATRPGAADVGQLDIAFTDLTGSHVITNQLSGGEIGGLLSFRQDILDPGQNRLGLIAIGIGEEMNRQHRLGVDLNGDLGTALFKPSQMQILANGNNLGAATATGTILDSGALTASDYLLEADGGGGYTLTRLADDRQWTYSSGDVVDGFSLTLSGAASAGDRFLVRPTRLGAEMLTLELNDPRRFAAAGPLRSAPAPGNGGTGSMTQPVVSDPDTLSTATNITLTFDAAGNRFDVDTDGDGVADTTLAYDPASDSGGKSFTLSGFGDPEFTVSGTPQDGDRFTIAFNRGGVGDNRNALAMAELQHVDTMLEDTSGNGTATFQETYAQLVSDVGSKTRHAEVNSKATDGLLERHEMSLSAVNGVNLDEEAANLIRYQQAYQASAQVIAVASTLFDTLLNAVRR